jgi:HD-like signal output (HDOD) protein
MGRLALRLAESERRMIQGEIQTFPLPDLIQWLALTHRTGELTITQDPLCLKFFFERGEIAATFSSEPLAAVGRDHARAVLTSALGLRRGGFQFNIGPLGPQMITGNLRLPAEAFLLDVVSQLEATRKSTAVSGQDEWTDAETYSETFTLADALRMQIVDRLLREDFRVPPMPQLAVRVLELTRKDDFSLRDLASLILTDQAITAQVLRCANSVYRGADREVTTLPMAVQRLGSDEVVNIVLATSLQARAGRDLFAAHRRNLWAHSSVAAFCARALAAQTSLDHNLGFLCGLLMDFGSSVLYSLIQDLIGRGTTAPRIPTESVAEIVQTYHPRVGRMVGEKWRLPRAVIQSMTHHHCLGEAEVDLPYVAVSALAYYLASFGLSQPRVGLEDAILEFTPERLMAHPAARTINLDTDGAIAVLADLPQLMDQALRLVLNQ